jgi:hypothetical protein
MPKAKLSPMHKEKFEKQLFEDTSDTWLTTYSRVAGLEALEMQ